ncbi:SIR2 family protein [Flavobacterium sp.]|uniref:SIR2 family protein n=1 Tax=Flavobacterium sp. TaxID=239 RepID=UPI00263141D6|nr:SIR2 family protein [Flavobacterium sp.]
MDIEKLKNTIQDSNLNFLVGSGLSVPYFSTLGNVELLLTELNDDITLNPDEKNIIRVSILGKYYDTVISQNPSIIDDTKIDANKTTVMENYKDFLVLLNTIVLKRKSSILNKQVNLFTTNIDVFIEKALEDTQLEYNDGFYGRFKPVFSLTNFKKSLFKKSLHYDNTSEIPVFNLLKVHGSLTWKSENDKIVYSELKEIHEIKIKWDAVKTKVIDFAPTDKLAHFIKEVKSKTIDSTFEDFINTYDKLAVVNPTKEKFQDTILNLHYYELLRVLSNELEKENTILFIMGFSLADEHIREIVLRAANSNPTLTIKIFAYDSPSKVDIEKNVKKGNTTIRYNNIEIIEPDSGVFYDFKTLNSNIFKAILDKID